MAKRQTPGNPTLNTAAETVGRLAGQVKARVDAFVADHPHPIDEAKDALADGREKLNELVDTARPYAASAASAVSAVVERGRSVATTAVKSVASAVNSVRSTAPTPKPRRRVKRAAKKAKPAKNRRGSAAGRRARPVAKKTRRRR
jgi:hypothetical protein